MSRDCEKPLGGGHRRAEGLGSRGLEEAQGEAQERPREALRRGAGRRKRVVLLCEIDTCPQGYESKRCPHIKCPYWPAGEIRRRRKHRRTR